MKSLEISESLEPDRYNSEEILVSPNSSMNDLLITNSNYGTFSYSDSISFPVNALESSILGMGESGQLNKPVLSLKAFRDDKNKVVIPKLRFPVKSFLNNKIGIVRLFLAIASFSFVVSIFPGLFGAPLSWLSGYLPPPSTQEFDITERFDKMESNDVYKNFPSKVKHQNLKNFKMPLGLKGFFDYDEALNYSKQTNKPIFLDFTGFACENCRLMEHNVWAKPHILETLKNDFIIVSLFVDSKYKLDENDWVDNKGKIIKQLGLKNLHIQTEKYNNAAQPLYVIINSNEEILSGPIGYCGEDEFYQFLIKGR